MTKSRDGCVMYGDHPKFRARLQTISVKHMRACSLWRPEPGLKWKIRGSNTAATAGLSDRQDI
jgi:hypothetical protein